MKTPTLQEIESVREAVDIVDIVMEHLAEAMRVLMVDDEKHGA